MPREYSDFVWTGGAARASKPVSICKGNFGRKRNPFSGILLETEAHVSQILGTRMTNTKNVDILEKQTHA